MHLLPARAAVTAAEKAHAVGEEHRAGLRRTHRQGVGVHHAFRLGAADDAAPQPRISAELQEVAVAAFPAVTPVAAVHDAADLEGRVDLARLIRVGRDADDVARKVHAHHPFGLGWCEFHPAPAAVAAPVDGGALRADVERSRILGVDQD